MPRKKKEKTIDTLQYDFTIHVTAERRGNLLVNHDVVTAVEVTDPATCNLRQMRVFHLAVKWLLDNLYDAVPVSRDKYNVMLYRLHAMYNFLSQHPHVASAFFQYYYEEKEKTQ